jgi:hypothetical protein
MLSVAAFCCFDETRGVRNDKGASLDTFFSSPPVRSKAQEKIFLLDRERFL